MQHSESLLNEILLLLQTLNKSVNDFRVELGEVQAEMSDLSIRFDEFIATAMPDGLVEEHAAHHRKIGKPSWRKRIGLYFLKE
ncbi:hypothetical protein FDI24_gp180 [Acidovorax phage ACP17]|uniref:Uncharacterized protein n=1 Tax=Acidovorax phage ACP17 TaxID=2010329 RepID=A0A218M338_9CAUD|nr:hypothetical protein FDI24_gp180 [Acidovorax phage ACP17]ASD50462.1 hypothetical protein [Acidovorax phage ACP17]